MSSYKPYYDHLFFDLQKHLTTDEEFVQKVTDLLNKMQKADKNHNADDFRRYMTELLWLCDFNPSLLTSYFFPKYPGDKPMTLYSRPHAMSMMSFIPNGTLTVQASRQIGKCVGGKTQLNVRVDGTDKILSMEQLFSSVKKKAS